jgi:membrane-associated phospholipid phosphatase
VAFSRVYTGVHYPGDVLVGAAVGTVIGRLTSAVARRVRGPGWGLPMA